MGEDKLIGSGFFGGLSNIDLRIGSVDRFQGMEEDIVIISFVRNNNLLIISSVYRISACKNNLFYPCQFHHLIPQSFFFMRILGRVLCASGTCLARTEAEQFL